MTEDVAKRTYYFTSNVVISLESLQSLVDDLVAQQFEIWARVDYDSGGETHLPGSEILDKWSQTNIEQTELVVLFFAKGKTSGFFQFVKLNAKNILHREVPSWLHVKTSDHSDLRFLRDLRDTMEMTFNSVDYQLSDRFLVVRGKTGQGIKGSVKSSHHPSSSKISMDDTVSPPFWKDPKWAIGTLIAVLGLATAVYFGKQSSNVTLVQAKNESAAIFTLKRIPADYSPDRLEIYQRTNTTPFDISIKNVGKGTATNVALRCGTPDEHGPYAPLGTIAAGTQVEIHSTLTDAGKDILHSGDSACYSSSSVYLFYDDPSGHQTIRFDIVGNAISVPE